MRMRGRGHRKPWRRYVGMVIVDAGFERFEEIEYDLNLEKEAVSVV